MQSNSEDTLWVKLDNCNLREAKAKRVGVISGRRRADAHTHGRLSGAVAQLASALEKNTYLTSLDLSSNALESAAVQVRAVRAPWQRGRSLAALSLPLGRRSWQMR